MRKGEIVDAPKRFPQQTTGSRFPRRRVAPGDGAGVVYLSAIQEDALSGRGPSPASESIIYHSPIEWLSCSNSGMFL